MSKLSALLVSPIPSAAKPAVDSSFVFPPALNVAVRVVLSVLIIVAKSSAENVTPDVVAASPSISQTSFVRSSWFLTSAASSTSSESKPSPVIVITPLYGSYSTDETVLVGMTVSISKLFRSDTTSTEPVTSIAAERVPTVKAPPAPSITAESFSANK